MLLTVRWSSVNVPSSSKTCCATHHIFINVYIATNRPEGMFFSYNRLIFDSINFHKDVFDSLVHDVTQIRTYVTSSDEIKMFRTLITQKCCTYRRRSVTRLLPSNCLTLNCGLNFDENDHNTKSIGCLQLWKPIAIGRMWRFFTTLNLFDCIHVDLNVVK